MTIPVKWNNILAQQLLTLGRKCARKNRHRRKEHAVKLIYSFDELTSKKNKLFIRNFNCVSGRRMENNKLCICLKRKEKIFQESCSPYILAYLLFIINHEYSSTHGTHQRKLTDECESGFLLLAKFFRRDFGELQAFFKKVTQVHAFYSRYPFLCFALIMEKGVDNFCKEFCKTLSFKKIKNFLFWLQTGYHLLLTLLLNLPCIYGDFASRPHYFFFCKIAQYFFQHFSGNSYSCTSYMGHVHPLIIFFILGKMM